MTLKELKRQYAHLSDEIDALATAGVRHEARLMRLLDDLDQVHRELSERRRRTLHAPTLRDAVIGPESAAARPVVGLPLAAPAAQPQPMSALGPPALSMAG
jgi:hypothetical protein